MALDKRTVALVVVLVLTLVSVAVTAAIYLYIKYRRTNDQRTKNALRSSFDSRFGASNISGPTMGSFIDQSTSTLSAQSSQPSLDRSMPFFKKPAASSVPDLEKGTAQMASYEIRSQMNYLGREPQHQEPSRPAFVSSTPSSVPYQQTQLDSQNARLASLPTHSAYNPPATSTTLPQPPPVALVSEKSPNLSPYTAIQYGGGNSIPQRSSSVSSTQRAPSTRPSHSKNIWNNTILPLNPQKTGSSIKAKISSPLTVPEPPMLSPASTIVSTKSYTSTYSNNPFDQSFSQYTSTAQPTSPPPPPVPPKATTHQQSRSRSAQRSDYREVNTRSQEKTNMVISGPMVRHQNQFTDLSAPRPGSSRQITTPTIPSRPATAEPFETTAPSKNSSAYRTNSRPPRTSHREPPLSRPRGAREETISIGMSRSLSNSRAPSRGPGHSRNTSRGTFDGQEEYMLQSQLHRWQEDSRWGRASKVGQVASPMSLF